MNFKLLKNVLLKTIERNLVSPIGIRWYASALEALNNDDVVIVIGRGHSGTRTIATTLKNSGYYIGGHLNKAHDLLPPDSMYRAARLPGKHVCHVGRATWDFSKLIRGPIEGAFYFYLHRFLKDIIAYEGLKKGWKLPETTLVYPWLVRLLPNARFIFWVRDPRDSILKQHNTDNLWEWNIDGGEGNDVYETRALSWKYQWDLVNETPPPKRFLLVRFEDFVLNQNLEINRLSDFLETKLRPVTVRKDRVGVWKTVREVPNYDFLTCAMQQLQYSNTRN